MGLTPPPPLGFPPSYWCARAEWIHAKADSWDADGARDRWSLLADAARAYEHALTRQIHATAEVYLGRSLAR